MNYGDRSDAFYKKMIIVKFNNQIFDRNIDVMLPKKLEKEKEYLFLWAMEGLKRLIENGFRFTETDSSKDIIEQYKLKSNNVLAFIKACYEIQEEGEVKSLALYNAYKYYCK